MNAAVLNIRTDGAGLAGKCQIRRYKGQETALLHSLTDSKFASILLEPGFREQRHGRCDVIHRLRQ